jgi:hypothetical protein
MVRSFTITSKEGLSLETSFLAIFPEITLSRYVQVRILYLGSSINNTNKVSPILKTQKG